MPKANKKEKSVSGVVEFRGKALEYINDLQSKHYEKYHKILKKSDATNELLSHIPASVIEKSILEIMNKE